MKKTGLCIDWATACLAAGTEPSVLLRGNPVFLSLTGRKRGWGLKPAKSSRACCWGGARSHVGEYTDRDFGGLKLAKSALPRVLVAAVDER